MPSDKCNIIGLATKAMGLSCSLFNVAFYRDVPFRQPLQFQCSHYGFTKAYLLFSFDSWAWVMIYVSAASYGFLEDFVIVLIAELFNMLSFWLKCSVECWTTLKTKHNCPLAFLLWLIDPGGTHAVTSEFSVLPYNGNKRYLSYLLCLECCATGRAYAKYKAYWHMNFYLINGCGTRENNICGQYSFEVALVSSPHIIICYLKANKQV